MNVAVRTPSMTREQFLDWAARQEAPYEFDGFVPVAMTGANRNHARLCLNVAVALRIRLDQERFEVLPEGGIATVGNAVRYPDVVITPAGGNGSDRLMADPIVAFEVVSPSSGRTDRVTKLREYGAVASLRRYVIVDHVGPDLLVFARSIAGQPWTATALTAGETLSLPEVGIEVPVDEVFVGVTFPEELSGSDAAG